MSDTAAGAFGPVKIYLTRDPSTGEVLRADEPQSASDTAAGAVQLSADLNHGAWLERVALFACMVHQHPDFDDTPSPLADAARAVEAEADQLRTILEGVAATPPAATQVPSAVMMTPMTFDDGRKGWYVSTPDFYLDIEHDAEGKWSAFFRNAKDGREAFADQAALRTPAAPEAGSGKGQAS